MTAATVSSALAGSGVPWPQDLGAHASRRVTFQPMSDGDLEAVHELEKQAYPMPWSRRHFADSIAAGYQAVMLLGELMPGETPTPGLVPPRVLLGYLVAMSGYEEVHLLNITVAPTHQHQGWGRFLLDALALWSSGQGAHSLWLEVRQGNAPARRLYERYGFATAGVRRAYYPAAHGQREDAVVMCLSLNAPEGSAL